MALEFSSNIKLADIVLDINPEDYEKRFQVFGSQARTTIGNLVMQEVSRKYIFTISGISQTQFIDIQKRAALTTNLPLIDYIPITEKGEATRAILEDLGGVQPIVNKLVQTYIPIYTICILDYIEKYKSNAVEYTILAEEI